MKKVKLPSRERLGKKAYCKKAEVGKWFAFNIISAGEFMIGFGKIVAIKKVVMQNLKNILNFRCADHMQLISGMIICLSVFFKKKS